MINHNVQALERLQELGRLLLLKAYKGLGVFVHNGERYSTEDIIKKSGIITSYTQLNEALLQILVEAGFIKIDGEIFEATDAVDKVDLDDLNRKKDLILQQYPVLSSHIKLLWECLFSYIDILRGIIPATQIMFPESSMELVEGVYKGNDICDVFNMRVAKSVKLYLDAKISKLNAEEKINILEIGSGTGGTSAFILKEIKDYEKHINYVYTDISQGFTMYGEKMYFKDYPFMQFKVLDIEKDIEGQGFEPNTYDVVIGANVIHATKNMAYTLMNAKRLLKKNSWLLLNELTHRWEFATLTFGLLQGWWLSEDKEARIKWSPLLSEDMWRSSLTKVGFRNVVCLGEDKNLFNNFSQHVIIGESDGVISLRNSKVNDIKSHKEEVWTKNEEAVVEADAFKEYVSSKITSIIAEILHIKINKISPSVPLWDYGVDSILIGIIVSKANKELEASLKNSDLFSYSTIAKLAEYIASNPSQKMKDKYIGSIKPHVGDKVNTQDKAETNNSADIKLIKNEENRYIGDIAIIGIAGRFPMAEDAWQYWRNMEEGKDCISEIPCDRWDVNDFYSPNQGEPGKSNCKYGGFISDVDKFDPLFFNLSPKQAELMDPRQRQFLQEAWRVIEDAGYSRKAVEGKKLGVFLGSEGETEYLSDKFEYPEDYSSHLFLGNSNSIMSARISYFMDLKGPCVTIDTACSSSLVAVHTACESLKTGNCDMAIAGGVQIMLTPRSYLLLSKMNMLSPEGKCKTFDNSANGFVPGEAVAAVLLKPLAQAIKDKDHIYCVIKGSATNQDGKSNGITAPNVLAQEELECDVYNKFGISPETITYVEAHGTGTKLGDPVEVEGLTKAFAKFTSDKQYCAIGSVKSNMGHAGAASGVSSLIKVALSLENNKIPPSINFHQANEEIQFENTPFYVNTQLKDWNVKSGLPKRAAVSSFGHSGTNCHIVLEEAPKCVAEDIREELPYYIVAISAETVESYKRRVADLGLWIKGQGRNASIGDISYTSLVGRSHMSIRSALVVRNFAELEKSLDLLLNGQTPQIYIHNIDNQEGNLANKSAGTLDVLISKLNSDASEPIYSNNLIEVANFYASGVDFEWEKLFANKCYKRISMPVYPFMKNRYWDFDSSNKFKKRKTSASKAGDLHPLLGMNTSTLREQSFKSTFDGSEFYFKDHIVQGQKILPGVAHIEMARAAGEIAGERKVRKIKNIVWARPIVHDKEKLDVAVSLHPVKDGVDYRISTLTQNGEKIVNSQGRIFYESEEAITKEFVDIEEIKRKCSKSLSGDESYLRFTQLGMNLGAGFRVTYRIWIGESEVISHIKLPLSQKQTFESYGLHPSMMDGTLQAMIGLMNVDETGLCIPYAMGEIEIFSEPMDECYSLIKLSEEQGNSEFGVKKFDVKVIDKNGQVIINIRDVLARPVKWDEQSCGVTYIKEDWHQADFHKEIVNFSNREVLVFSEELGEPNTIKVVAYHGETPKIYTINPLNIDDFYKLFSELRSLNINTGKIVFKARGAEDFEDMWSNSYLSMFNLVKALSAMNSIMDTSIIYSFRSKTAMPLNAAVRGFGAAIQKENPRINIKTVQFENAAYDSDDELEILLKEFGKVLDNVRHDVLYKSSIRYIKKYKEVRIENSKNERLKLKAGGVYVITGGTGSLGRIFAEYFAGLENVKLVLSGRSITNKKIDELLARLQKLGSQAICVKADVSKREDVKYIIDEAQKHFGKIDGIIHSAGMVKDAFIQNKSIDDISNVIEPKVNGLVYLDELTKDQDLDFFVAFSSISSVLGNAGQCDYSFANSFMNYYAMLREELRIEGKRKGKTISIAWPLWINGGMNVDESTKELIYTTMGMKGLSNEKGLEIFNTALAHEYGFLAVFEGDRNKILKSLGVGIEEQKLSNDAKPIEVSRDRDGNDRDLVVKVIKKSVSEVMNLMEKDINLAKNFSVYGFDSISFTDLSNSINRGLGLEITPAIFFQYPSINEVTDYLIKNFMKDISKALDAQTTVKAVEYRNDNAFDVDKIWVESFIENRFIGSVDSQKIEIKEKNNLEEPIAVIGMSGVFPRAEDLEAFWKHLESGDNLVSEIPSDRWDWKSYYGDPKKEPNKTNVKWGGFIDSVDKFDASYFRISPREARLMDPQQRISMEMVWKAIEDSGYKPSDLAGTDTALFMGVSAIDYSELINEYGIEPEAYTSTGIAHSVLVNRISFLLDIHGPSEPIDTACSSSLIAIHRGIEAIRSGDSKIAIVGGVNVLLSPSVYISFSKAGMLSEDGRCKSFDKDANGYVRGEGAGIIVLKPLSKAQADGDHIYALIKGSAENHGGKANSLTAPNPNAQAAVIKSALRKAGVHPDTISYIEAHGSGTSLGDPIEVNALKKAFDELSEEKPLTSVVNRSCGIGSVKTNIGHLEAAAGIAGIIKVILAMKNKKIPASINFKELNPYIKLEETPFYIVSKTKKWENLKDDCGSEIPRRAGVSSFGFGGVNAHIVIEEYPESIKTDPKQDTESIIVLSANNLDRLKACASNLADFLEKREISIGDLAYTLQVGRDALEERLAFIASTKDEIIEKLKLYCMDKETIEGLYISNKKRESSVDLLIDGDEGQEFLKYILAERKYDKIMKLWVSGVDVDWNIMYSGESYRRISLPTYPFARNRYWLPKGTLNKNTDSYIKQTSIESAVISKKLNEMSYSRKVQAGEPVFRDHTIHEKPVLPGVAHIEFACNAFRELTGITKFNVSRVVWLVPFALESEESEIIAAFEEKKNGYTYEIRSIYGGTTIVHSKGMIVPQSHNSITNYNEIFDIAAIEARCTEWIHKDEFYSQLKKTCVTHGPYFQGLCKLGSNPREAIATVEMPLEFVNELEYSALHPTIMDCSLQGIAGIAANLFRKDGQPMLPFSIEDIEILKPFGTKVYSYIRQSGKDCFNVLILDEKGRVCVSIKDVSLRELKDQLQDYFFLPSWKHAPISELRHERHGAGGKTVIVYNSAEESFVLQLSKHLENSQVIFVQLSSETKKLKEDKWSIDYRCEDGFYELFKNIGSIEAIYFLGGVSLSSGEKAVLELVQEVEEKGILCLFRMVKALNNSELDFPSIELKVITNNLRKIYPEDIIAPFSAALTGFTVSMAKEYPDWKVCLIDIDAAEIEDEYLAEVVVNECGCTGGKEIAFRKSRRFAPSIEPVWLPPVNTSPYKKGGVYVIVGGAGGIGMTFASYLSGTVGAKVVLVGRSELNHIQLMKIDEMCSKGGEVLYIRADMTSPEMMEQAVSQIKAKFGRINGVIHSAIVLKDKTLDTMTEKDLKDVLAPKVIGTAVLHKVLKNENLDFMMFFSSSQSFTASLGQSNYAAACTFKDAYANYISQFKDFPVHIVNWGFWGTVGVVASEDYNRRLVAKGVGSITPDEGIEAVRRIISHNMRQVVTLKAKPNLLESIGIKTHRRTKLYKPVITPLLEKLADGFKGMYPYPDAVNFSDKNFECLEEYGRKMLLKAFRKMGVFLNGNEKYTIEGLKGRLGIISEYDRLFAQLINLLAQAGFVKIIGEIVISEDMVCEKGFVEELDKAQEDGLILADQNPEIKPHITLLTKCVENYPSILRGGIKATEVMFPGSSMDVVEGIYKGNVTADYYNSIAAGCIKEYLKQRMSQGKKDEKINILEVGAGTGGTSSLVLKEIACYGEDIKYYYTDISPAFTKHGKREYGSEYDFLEFKLLNIEKDCLEQGFTPGDYDIILATNVLHATRRIDVTLSNIKRLLKPNGWVVINETTRNLGFTTLTFGLLDGWWLYEDSYNRMSGCPVLSPYMWQQLLKEEGYEQIAVLGGKEDNGRQQSRQNVIIGESNGIVSYVSHAVKKEVEVTTEIEESIDVVNSKGRDDVKRYVQETVIRSVAKILGISEDEIDNAKQFNEYGIDSISTMELTNQLNDTLGITIKTTTLFDYGNVKDLAQYILERFSEKLLPVAKTIVDNNAGNNRSKDEVKKYIQETLIHSAAKILGISEDEIDTKRQFSEYGIDSISTMELTNELNDKLGITVRTTALFDYGNVKDLTQYVLENFSDKLAISKQDDIKIQKPKALSKDDIVKVIFQKLASGEITADEADKMMEAVYE